MRYYLTILLFICWNTSYAESYNDGSIAYQTGNYSLAYSIWLPLAEKGNSDAQNGLGILYKDGMGVEKNSAEAEKWLDLAAKQGNVSAQLNIADLNSSENKDLKNGNIVKSTGKKTIIKKSNTLNKHKKILEKSMRKKIKSNKNMQFNNDPLNIRN
jgi:TPR repeat protein